MWSRCSPIWERSGTVRCWREGPRGLPLSASKRWRRHKRRSTKCTGRWLMAKGLCRCLLVDRCFRAEGGGGGAPRMQKRHQREHRPQRPTERSDPTQHAKGRAGDCPGPRKGTATRRNVTQGDEYCWPVLRGPGDMRDCLVGGGELHGGLALWSCVLLQESPPPPPAPGKESSWLLEAPVKKIILQMHTPAHTSQCWSRQTPAWTRSVSARATARLRDGRPPE